MNTTMKKKIRHKDFNLAKDEILKSFKAFTEDTIEVPEQFASNPYAYKEFHVRSAIVGEISKLERLVFDE